MRHEMCSILTCYKLNTRAVLLQGFRMMEGKFYMGIFLRIHIVILQLSDIQPITVDVKWKYVASKQLSVAICTSPCTNSCSLYM